MQFPHRSLQTLRLRGGVHDRDRGNRRSNARRARDDARVHGDGHGHDIRMRSARHGHGRDGVRARGGVHVRGDVRGHVIRMSIARHGHDDVHVRDARAQVLLYHSLLYHGAP